MPRLLVVEDDSAVRATITTLLEVEGYQVDAVSSSRDALERLGGGGYPIIISDIYLDERTGLDILQAARKADPGCAVILMTGRGTMETVMKATEGGVFDYIAKPFELDQMLSAVKRAEASLAEDGDDDGAEIEDLPETEMIGSPPAFFSTISLIFRLKFSSSTLAV